jgi:hypothetical protein
MIADPMSHTPTRRILTDSHADWRTDSRRLWKSLRNHGLFAKKEKSAQKRKKREPPYGKVENAKSAFPTFPQGLPRETKKELKSKESKANLQGGPAAALVVTHLPVRPSSSRVDSSCFLLTNPMVDPILKVPNQPPTSICWKFASAQCPPLERRLRPSFLRAPPWRTSWE